MSVDEARGASASGAATCAAAPCSRRSAVWTGAAFVALALLIPQAWLTGGAGDGAIADAGNGGVNAGDPRQLVLGSWLLRGALAAVGVLFLAAPKFERPAAGPVAAPAPPRGFVLAAFALVVVAAALRAFRLDAPMWYDEIWMVVDSVRPPLGESLRAFTTDNDHPLYSFLATLCARAFGESAWTVRLPAAAFGVGSVWATWLFARDRFGPRIALTAAAALAFTSQHVWFSQNARGYSGLLFFTVLSSHFLLRALETGRRRDWVCHGVTLALCVAVHLTGAFTAVGHVAIVAASFFRRPRGAAEGGPRAGALGLALAVLLGFAAYALVFPQVVRFFLLRPDRVAVQAQWTDPAWLVTETARSFGAGVGPGIAVLAAGALVFALGLRAAWRRSPAVVVLVIVPAVAMAVAMLGLGRNLWPRLFFFLAAFVVVVAVAGAADLARRIAALVRASAADSAERIAVVAVVLAAAATLPRAYAFPKQDYGAALRWMQEERREGEPLVAIGNSCYVYREYYRAGLTEAHDAQALARAIPPGSSGLVVYSFPVYLESRAPEVWAEVRRRGRQLRRFRASMSGGDVVVLRVDG